PPLHQRPRGRSGGGGPDAPARPPADPPARDAADALAAAGSPFYSRASVDRRRGATTKGRTMRRRKALLAGLVALLGVVGALALATSVSAKQTGAFKVAWIYPGPHNDGGWSQAHDAGRLYVQKMLGSKVQTTYKENVFSNASVPQIVAGLV